MGMYRPLAAFHANLNGGLESATRGADGPFRVTTAEALGRRVAPPGVPVRAHLIFNQSHSESLTRGLTRGLTKDPSGQIRRIVVRLPVRSSQLRVRTELIRIRQVGFLLEMRATARTPTL